MIIAHGLYLANIDTLYSTPVYPPTLPLLKNPYAAKVDLLVQTLNPILLISSKIHCRCTILDKIFPLMICIAERGISEQKISLKGDGDGRDGNGAKVFASLFHYWYYYPVANFSLCLLSHAYHVAFQLVKKVSSLDANVFFLRYMGKLLFINSYSNQYEIGGQ